MSYLQFHLVFILPPILLLVLANRGVRRKLGPRAVWSLPVMALIAFVYTTPWDNYLVWREVWGYGNERVIGTIGYVPIEEYMFFVLQPLLTGFWLYFVLTRTHERLRPAGGTARWVGAAFWLAVSAAGVLLLQFEAGTYMGLILAWAGPVLAGQWAYAGTEIWRRRRSWLIGFAVPTLYLWIADWYAIRDGIWSISERYTLGPDLFGLPLEEAVFFLVTNLLVVQGLLLFLYPPGVATNAPERNRTEVPAAVR